MKALDIIINDVNFKLTVVEHDGVKWVPIRPICEVVGIKPHKQIERVEKDERFSCTQLGGTGTDGKTYQMTLKQQGEQLEYLMRNEYLRNEYVDKKLASAGGSWMSSYGHKKRKIMRGV